MYEMDEGVTLLEGQNFRGSSVLYAISDIAIGAEVTIAYVQDTCTTSSGRGMVSIVETAHAAAIFATAPHHLITSAPRTRDLCKQI